MVGAWGRVVVILGTLVGLFWPAFLFGVDTGGSVVNDPTVISRYDASVLVDDDGTLHAVERITTRMPAGRHGIFRYWDVVDTGDQSARLLPEGIAVTQDGEPAEVEMSWEGNRRYRVAKIGSVDATLDPGEHRYEVSYRIEGALAPDDPGSRLVWDVIARGWEMGMERTAVRVQLPDPATDAACTVGEDGAQGCRVQVRGDEVVVRTGALPPRTGVTLRASMATLPPGRVTLPWPASLDGVLSRSLPWAVLLGLMGVIAAFAGASLTRMSRERKPGLPVLYAPPEGIGPAQAVYLVNERVDQNALRATLLYQAEQGLTRIDRAGGRSGDQAWSVVGLDTPNAWATTDPATRAVGEALGVDVPGASFKADGRVSAGERLLAARESLGDVSADWARQTGLVERNGSEFAAKVFVVIALVAAGLIFAFNPFGVTLAGLPFAAFAVAGFGLLGHGVGSRRTAAGRDLWSRAGGFSRILQTPSGMERFDFSGREDRYTAYIPWAVAFGCADEWAAKYRTETLSEPDAPLWFAGGAVRSRGDGWVGALDSFDSSLQSSIGAYQASQSSSSSGGGGSGGGGGGSW